MPDGSIGVAQAPIPDRLVDNETVTTGAGSTYRQRVRVGGANGSDLADVVGGALKVTVVNQGRLFTQGTPSGTWIVLHNLGYAPMVQVRDSVGNPMIADIHHDSVNQFTINISPAQVGSVFYV